MHRFVINLTGSKKQSMKVPTVKETINAELTVKVTEVLVEADNKDCARECALNIVKQCEEDLGFQDVTIGTISQIW